MSGYRSVTCKLHGRVARWEPQVQRACAWCVRVAVLALTLNHGSTLSTTSVNVCTQHVRGVCARFCRAAGCMQGRRARAHLLICVDADAPDELDGLPDDAAQLHHVHGWGHGV